LLVAAEAQANGNPHGFLGEYNKFITPSVNHMKHGNGATMGFAATREQSLINTKEEEKAVQKLLANNNSNMSITLSAVGVALLSIAAMLGARMRRSPAATDMSINLAPGNNIMEMKSQGSDINKARSAGWGQPPPQSSQPATLCFANPGIGTGQGPSLEWGGSDTTTGGAKKLSEALEEADIERKKAVEEAERRAKWQEQEREEKLRKVAYMKEMPDDTPAGSVSDYMYKEGVKDQLDKLDYDLVGLLPVKQRVREIAALLVLDKMRRKLGFDTAVPSLHMCFTGAPGTGKTTVAVRMGQILAKMGYCRSGHVVVATRDDLVGQYVGHTAPKTKEVIKQALGGVLLVDEAYYLYNAANDRDYGQESIEILLTFMENNREDLVVVLAGYKDRMDKFFSFIPGMSSRIGNHIDFPNYQIDELYEISKVMARDLDYEMTDEAGEVFKKYIERRMQMPFFSNARTVRNAMDRARMNAAIRVFDDAVSDKNTGDVSAKDLQEIAPADFQVILDEALAAEDDAILA